MLSRRWCVQIVHVRANVNSRAWCVCATEVTLEKRGGENQRNKADQAR